MRITRNMFCIRISTQTQNSTQHERGDALTKLMLHGLTCDLLKYFLHSIGFKRISESKKKNHKKTHNSNRKPIENTCIIIVDKESRQERTSRQRAESNKLCVNYKNHSKQSPNRQQLFVLFQRQRKIMLDKYILLDVTSYYL